MRYRHLLFFTVVTAVFTGIPALLGAQTETNSFVPITGGLPGIESNASFGDYVNSFFQIALGVAALLAIVRIMYAGFKYLFSEVVTDKASAKDELIGAVLGLLVVFGAITILNEINPNITNFTLFENGSLESTLRCEDYFLLRPSACSPMFSKSVSYPPPNEGEQLKRISCDTPRPGPGINPVNCDSEKPQCERCDGGRYEIRGAGEIMICYFKESTECAID